MQSVHLTTADGVRLDADLLVATDTSAAAVVVCHPHPLYGGNRHNPVVDTAFRAVAATGATSLRFDFRPDFDGGVGERNDVIAALDEVGRHTTGRSFVIGYSFGAAVALGTRDDRIQGIVAIAPPLSMVPVDVPGVATLVLMPEHDQFTTIDTARAASDAWPDSTLEVIEGADHFLVGAADRVATSATDWLAHRPDVCGG